MAEIIFIDACKSCNKDFEEYELGREFSVLGDLERTCVDCVFTETCGRTGRKALCDNMRCKDCYTRSYASHKRARYWDYEKNEKVPRGIRKGYNEKVWHVCGNCNHNFSSKLSNITSNKRWCPYCSNQTRKLCKNNDCLHCYNRSFASHKNACHWDYKNNGNITPRDIALNCTTRYWFICNMCNHNFFKKPNDINNKLKLGWCPYCAKYKGELCENSDCTQCHNKSFASHEKAQFWDPIKNKGLIPRLVPISSNSLFWFICDNCSHSFNASPNNITSVNSPWCPYCCIPGKLLCENNNCLHCYNRSFASHEKARYWDYEKNNGLIPRDIKKGTNVSYYFICKNNHNFSGIIYNIVSNDSWCPKCKNKTERKLLEYLTGKNYEVLHQPKYDWCKNPKTGKYLPFDFSIESLRIIIELDGIQHFKQVSNWSSPEDAQQRDFFKQEKALENGYTVIRIYQPMVLKDSGNWREELEEILVHHEIPSKIFICEDGKEVVYEEY